MQTGLQALQQVIDESKNRGDFSGGALSYFSWKDKDRKVIRFLTDDVLTAEFHEFIITNDGKTKSFLIDPAKGDFVAKYASPTPGLGWKQNWKTKQPEERKPTSKTVGLAVLRDRVAKDGGGFEVIDALTEIDFKGEKFPARTFGLVTQAHGNFWKSLIGYYGLYGTICDRDYLIERTGSDKDTEYTIVPLDPVEELRDIDVIQSFYGYGRPWADEDPERFLFCPQTLQEWADHYSSEDRAKHFLLPASETAAATPNGNGSTVTAPVMSTTTGQAVVHQQAVPQFQAGAADEAQAAVAVAAPPANTDFASLRDKLLAHKK